MLLSITLSLLAGDPPISNSSLAHARVAPRKAAAELIQDALEARTWDPLSDLGKLERGAEAAAEVLGDGRPTKLLLEAARDAQWRAVIGRERAADEFGRTLAELADDLRFEPLIEADLPVGFPPPTPVHTIEFKQYPAYRLASAPIDDGSRSNGAFWKLFQHIQRNDIAMTAPVEVTYEDSVERAGDKPREERMAFLYGTSTLGQLGSDRDVEVLDVPPLSVVSIGLRGRLSIGRVEDARAELQRWINERPQLQIVGPMRSMGYNSPMVPSSRRLFEVQIPVGERRAL